MRCAGELLAMQESTNMTRQLKRIQASVREPGQRPTPVRPETAEDREYLKMMYEEQAEHARSHEELRGTATGLFMALIAGLLAFAVTEGADPRREWVAGAMIFGVSLVGSIITYKHYERYEMHLSRLRGFRQSLELGLTRVLRSINDEWTKYHNEIYWFSHKWLKLHVLWLAIYVVTGAAGCILVLLGWLGTHPVAKAAENPAISLAESKLVLGLNLDWSAVATLITGLAAVAAAYWTVKRTERAGRMETTQRKRAVAARAVAVLEVARERVESISEGETGPVLPWNAFSALSADIGLLGIDATRLFFFIERLAREAEHTANSQPNGRPSDEEVGNLLASIRRLLPICIRQVDGADQTSS